MKYITNNGTNHFTIDDPEGGKMSHKEGIRKQSSFPYIPH